MKEIREILKAYDQMQAAGLSGALATVVRVQGSSYRRPGARMLIQEDGRWTGAISGGCLEGDALRRARAIMQSGQPDVITYDTTEDASATSLAVGLGCNGIIDVLIEPVRADSDPVAQLRAYARGNQPGGLATVFGAPEGHPLRPGHRLWLPPAGEAGHSLPAGPWAAQFQSDLQAALAAGRSRLATYDEGVQVLLEVIQPPVQLWIFGAGYDSMPLSRLAGEMGWDIFVSSDCGAKVIPARFPEARQVTHLERATIATEVPVTPTTAAVVMSHNYAYDKTVVSQLLPLNLPYLGVLGPRTRTDKLLRELAEAGQSIDREGLYSPVGLDLGAETAEEIALSIVAEIQAVMRQRRATPLRERQGPIHPRETETV
ncbi:MAG: XdhC/CoxI family protein [Bacteroidetes bacterium]|nr:MAG: XdhC/CoxI family protein [Bacteroidota bacterium]